MSLARDEASRESYFAAREKFYERKVAGIYRSALDDIRKEMSAIYERYAINGILSRADMTRYNRLATLEKNILKILTPAVRASLKEIDRLRPEEYGEAFFRTGWAIDNATGVGLTWGPLNTKAITAELDSSPFYAAGKERTLITIPVEVTTAINNGLAMGQSYTEMMRDLKGLVNKKAFETMRILRTELHTAQELGTSAAYDEALEQGVKGKVVWVATLDGRTRDSHAAMDGVARDEDGMFHGVITAEYPGDPALDAEERINCRCDIRFELEGFAPAIRRSQEDGIIPYQTYDQWSKDKQFFQTGGASASTIEKLTQLENKEFKIVSSNVENGIIADANGRILAYIEGDTEKNIFVPEKYDEILKNSVFSHNHPINGGGSFSKGDIAWAAGHDVAEIRMVAPIVGDREHIMFTSMKRPDNGWGPGWWGDNYNKYEQAEEYTFQELVKHQKTGRPTREFDYDTTLWEKFSELAGTKYSWGIKSVKN